MLRILADRWWVFLLRGIVAILFGIAAIAWPGITLVVLLAMFAAFVIVDGVLDIIAGIAASGENERWWLLLLEGLAGIVVGVIAIVAPVATVQALSILAAAWAVVTGVFEIVTAIRIRKLIEGEWLMILAGIASILLGILIFVRPGAALAAFAIIVGIYAILFGLLLIVLAFRLRGLRERSRDDFPVEPTPGVGV